MRKLRILSSYTINAYTKKIEGSDEYMLLLLLLKKNEKLLLKLKIVTSL